MCSASKREDSPAGSFWRVEVDVEKCSVCEVCTRHCSPGAIRSVVSGQTLSIVFRPGVCDGCGACLEHCPEEAVRLVQVEVLPAGEERVLVESEMLHCEVCGTYFAPVSKLQAASRKKGSESGLIREQCPLCRRTEMVARFIEEKRESSGRKAEYRTGKKWHFKPVAQGDPDGPPCPEVLDLPARQRGQGSGDEEGET